MLYTHRTPKSPNGAKTENTYIRGQKATTTNTQGPQGLLPHRVYIWQSYVCMGIGGSDGVPLDLELQLAVPGVDEVVLLVDPPVVHHVHQVYVHMSQRLLQTKTTTHTEKLRRRQRLRRNGERQRQRQSVTKNWEQQTWVRNGRSLRRLLLISTWIFSSMGASSTTNWNSSFHLGSRAFLITCK